MPFPKVAMEKLKAWAASRIAGVFPRERAQGPPEEGIGIGALPPLEKILERADAAPEPYRNPFLPAPLESDGLLVGGGDVLDRLDEALRYWLDGYPASIALVGPQGCGKTSLLNCFRQNLPTDRKIVCSELSERLRSERNVVDQLCRCLEIEPACADLDGLILELEKLDPRIVILEGGHHLLLRVIGGRRAVEAFVHVMLATRRRHLWLVSFRSFPWGNLDRHVDLARYFSYVVPLESASEDALREMFERRRSMTGLEFIFRSGESDTQEERGTNEGEKVEARFHERIYHNSGGNFHAALYFFMLCSHWDLRTGTVSLDIPDRLDTSVLDGLDRLHLLTLAEIAGHGALSCDEHRQIFRTEGLQSPIMLELLRQMGIIECISGSSAETPVYELSPVIHHAVTQALEQLHFLY